MATITTYTKSANESYTNIPIAAGTDRLVVLAFTLRGSTFRTMVSCTLNGTSATELGHDFGIDGGLGCAVNLVIFNEADLPAGGSTYTIAPTYSGTVNINALTVIEFENAGQITPFIGTVQEDKRTVTAGPVALTGTVTDGLDKPVIGIVSFVDGNDLTGSAITASSANLGGLVNGTDQTQLQTFTMIDDVCASSSENYSMTTTTNSQTVDSLVNLFFSVNVTAATGPTLTGPTSGKDGETLEFTGTDLDTVFFAAGITDGGTYNRQWTHANATATTIDLTLDSGASSATLGNPVAGIPLEPTITAAGMTPYSTNAGVLNGDGSGEIGFTLNTPDGYDVIQSTIADANTTVGESIWAYIGGMEDDNQAQVPKTVDSTTLTWNSNGTFTASDNAAISFDVPMFSNSTGQWSLLRVTASGGSIVVTEGLRPARALCTKLLTAGPEVVLVCIATSRHR